MKTENTAGIIRSHARHFDDFAPGERRRDFEATHFALKGKLILFAR